MSARNQLLKTFVVCAGLFANPSMAQDEMAQNAPQSPGSKAPVLFNDKNSGQQIPLFGFIDYFSRESFMYHRCVKIPEDDFTYETDIWTWDCSIRPTDSGDFLIMQMLETEYKKRTGTFVAPKSYPDKQVFNFVG